MTSRSSLRMAVAALVAASVVTAAPAMADETYWVPADERIAADGHGYGHGRGMSQFGAKGAAESGRTWQQILAFYYPRTTLTSLQRPGSIRVLLTADDQGWVRVSPTQGLVVRDLGAGTTTSLAAAGAVHWDLRRGGDGKVHVWWRDGNSRWHHTRTLAGDGEFRAPGLLTLWQDGVTKRTYRGALRAARISGRIRTVNVVGLDDYVRGVVPAEMPATWHPNAVRAQSVAARTYALRHRSASPGRWFHVDDTISYQVYGGVGSEHSASNAAVSVTAGHVISYGGAPALTEFSSSSGGLTAASSLPYQVVMHDPYDARSGNPNHRWSTTMDAGTLERRYGLGDLQRIVVTERGGCGAVACDWGGRLEKAQLVGTQRTVTVSGNDLRTLLGLRSTWFAPQQTPIILRWQQMGGASSFLGSPRAAESPVAGGAVQRFDGADMYHHPSTGAHEVHGAIAWRYRALGGPSGFLGFPTRDERAGAVSGSRVSLFQRGRIYHHRAIGQREVHGLLARKYVALGAEGGFLGLPTSDEHAGKVSGSRVSDFQRGSIFHHRSTGRHEVHGLIARKYAELGAEGGFLGLPTSDEHAGQVPRSRVSDFQRGAIYHHHAIGQVEVHGRILAAYRRVGAEAGRLGLPTRDEYAVPEGRRSDFQKGHIVWDVKAGQATVHYD